MKNHVFRKKVLPILLFAGLIFLFSITIFKFNNSIIESNKHTGSIIAVIDDNPGRGRSESELQQKRSIRFVAYSLSNTFERKEIASKPFPYRQGQSEPDLLLINNAKTAQYRFVDTQAINGNTSSVCRYFDFKITGIKEKNKPPVVDFTGYGSFNTDHEIGFFTGMNTTGNMMIDNLGYPYSNGMKWDALLDHSFYNQEIKFRI